MIDRDKLQRLWAGSTLSIRDLAVYFHTTPYAIAGTVRRARAAEGTECWPLRQSNFTRPTAPPRPKRAGTSTLPPLRSLDQ